MSSVPTYVKTIQVMINTIQDYRREERLLKTKLMAQYIGLEQQQVAQDEIQRRRIDHKVAPKEFHVKEGDYKVPKQGLNYGSPVYETSNLQYGQLIPTSFELHEKYYPRNNQFTTTFQQMNYKFDGLNTSVAFSKVHKQLDEY